MRRIIRKNFVVGVTMAHRSWFRGTALESRSLAGELSLSCARHVADG